MLKWSVYSIFVFTVTKYWRVGKESTLWQKAWWSAARAAASGRRRRLHAGRPPERCRSMWPTTTTPTRMLLLQLPLCRPFGVVRHAIGWPHCCSGCRPNCDARTGSSIPMAWPALTSAAGSAVRSACADRWLGICFSCSSGLARACWNAVASDTADDGDFGSCCRCRAATMLLGAGVLMTARRRCPCPRCWLWLACDCVGTVDSWSVECRWGANYCRRYSEFGISTNHNKQSQVTQQNRKTKLTNQLWGKKRRCMNYHIQYILNEYEYDDVAI